MKRAAFTRELFPVLLILLMVCISCNDFTDQKVAKSFYASYNSGDIARISELIHKDIRIYAGNELVADGKADVLVQMEWDTVFNARIDILDISAKSDTLQLELVKTGKRIRFLHDEGIRYRVKMVVKDRRVLMVQEVETHNLNLEKFVGRRDSLIRFMETHYPELEGFHQDLSRKGGENYLFLIEKYREAHNQK